ncbi:MAG: sugar phosphate isomerase/epimerase [Ruminococcaceae bacterium]|nr:sugar phosphate isomerase/epimerase [Oscillospiraceae bacterium]
MFFLSAFADEYDLDFDKQLQGLKQNHLQYIEVRNADGINVAQWPENKATEIAEKLNKYNIQVSAIGSPLGKVSADCAMSEYIKTIENVCYIADILSCNLIRIFSFYRPDGMSDPAYKNTVFDKTEKMLHVAARYNKQLCLENEAGLYGESPEKCLELLDCFGGVLKCCFDMGNFRLQGYDPYPAAYELLKKYIAYFHIKDSFDHGAIVPAGCGNAKIKEILTAYDREFGRDCFVSVEPHLVTFDGLNDLTSEKIEHKFVYATKEAAFADAVQRFRLLMQ